jgi:hypothetical protein
MIGWIYLCTREIIAGSYVVLWPDRRAEGNRPLARPRRRWVDNIKIDFGEISWGGVDWICMTRDRDKWRAFVDEVMNVLVP